MRRPRALVCSVAVALAVAMAGAGCKGAGQKPVEENPLTSDMVNYRNGLALLREGKVDEAIALFNAARASYPTEPAVANGLGLALLYKKDYQLAIRAFSEALRLNPEFVEARNNRGVAWMEMGKLKEAEADFQAVLGGNASREKLNAHFNQGLLEVKREAWAAAEREFTVVLAEDPKYARANRERGIVRVRREAFGDALDDLLRYLRIEPRDVSANYHAALALLTTGRRDVARKYMQRVVAAEPESDEAKKAKRFLDDEPAGPARKER